MIHHHNSSRAPVVLALTTAALMSPGALLAGSVLLSLASSRFTAICSCCGIGGSVVYRPTKFKAGRAKSPASGTATFLTFPNGSLRLMLLGSPIVISVDRGIVGV